MSDESRIMVHEYDGIREYDNPLPFWWSAVFVITIVFAGGYWFWYHGGGPGKSIHEHFAADWKAYEQKKAEVAAKTKLEVTEELLTEWAGDGAVIEAGKKLFATNCLGCHLDDGRGQTGPNLTDDFQIHGTMRLDIFTTIRDGVPAKGMIAWGQTLSTKDVATVAAFVSTLRGTNRPNGKAPEGQNVGKF